MNTNIELISTLSQTTHKSNTIGIRTICQSFSEHATSQFNSPDSNEHWIMQARQNGCNEKSVQKQWQHYHQSIQLLSVIVGVQFAAFVLCIAIFVLWIIWYFWHFSLNWMRKSTNILSVELAHICFFTTCWIAYYFFMAIQYVEKKARTSFYSTSGVNGENGCFCSQKIPSMCLHSSLRSFLVLSPSTTTDKRHPCADRYSKSYCDIYAMACSICMNAYKSCVFFRAFYL